MTCTIQIQCDNAAFFDEDDERRDLVCTNAEIVRILSRLCSSLERHYEETQIPLRDSNGNHVGEFRLTGK